MKTLTVTFIEFDDIRDESKEVPFSDVKEVHIKSPIPKSDLVMLVGCTWKRKSLLANNIKRILAESTEFDISPYLNKE